MNARSRTQSHLSISQPTPILRTLFSATLILISSSMPGKSALKTCASVAALGKISGVRQSFENQFPENYVSSLPTCKFDVSGANLVGAAQQRFLQSHRKIGRWIGRTSC